MTFTENAARIFQQAIADYHTTDNVDAPLHIPATLTGIEADLYRKCWIDTVQWHLEDIIRNPEIDPAEALTIKRRIDKSNQDRTDLVETIDSYFYTLYHEVTPQPDACINTESPAWAVDRLSILFLKIWHMEEQTRRTDAPADHLTRCQEKLDVLLAQRADLSSAIDQLLSDYQAGRRLMRVYKQMKMYNDPSMNPVLYGKKA